EIHCLTEKEIQSAYKLWENKFKNLKTPRICIFVGGTTPKQPFTSEDIQAFADKINKVKEEKNASLLLATSRKTTRKQTVFLKRRIQHDYFYTSKGRKSPSYSGLLAWADILIVVAPTVRSLSKTTVAQKPLYIYQSEGLIGKGNLKETPERYFIQMLYDMKIAQPFTNQIEKFTPAKFPNSTKEIAQLIDADLMIRSYLK
ncbi:MAG: mitochondrial fission ELM1 family protein, partial [Alphaproteobacteria bacterium]|nr:mitochondrial fission ELM1 family protein [Alphaproteobacteria bacterium]